jgi:hypothetical protein
MKSYRIIQHWIFLIYISIFQFFIWKDFGEGNLFFTGYRDWFYHAYRIESFSGAWRIPSWNNYFYQGISDWSGYQIIPDFLISLGVRYFDLSVSESMIYTLIATLWISSILAYFIQYKLSRSKVLAFVSSLVLFILPSLWISIGNFTEVFGIAIFLLSIFVWLHTRNFLRIVFVVLLWGISIWIHPVYFVVITFLVGIGFLELIADLWVEESSLIFWRKLIMGQIVAIISIFCVFGFIFLKFTKDFSVVSPFQTDISFVIRLFYPRIPEYIVVGILLFLLGGTILFGIHDDKKKSQIWIFYGIAFLFYTVAIFTFLVDNDLLRSLQLARTVFAQIFLLINIWLYFLSKYKNIIIKEILLYILIFAAIFGSFFVRDWVGYRTVDFLHDPVFQYATKHGVNGAVYFKDSTFFSQYNSSHVNFINGYHGHHLPNLLSVRLEMLLEGQEKSMANDVDKYQLIEAYAKILGVESIFLRTNNTNKRLLDKKWEYKGEYWGNDGKFLAYKAKWKLRQGVQIAQEDMAIFKDPITVENVDDWDQMDENIVKIAQILYEDNNPLLKVINIDKDKIYFELPEKGKYGFYTRNFSYGFEGKDISVVEIKPTNNNQFLILNEGYTKSIILHHQWKNVVKL